MGQKKYPDELRGRATRMALDALVDPGGPRARSAGSARSWVSTPRLCAPGSRRPRSMVV